MRIRRLRTIVGMLSWIMALSLAGCHSAQQPTPADVKAAAERADVAEEARGVAEAPRIRFSEFAVARGEGGGYSPALTFLHRSFTGLAGAAPGS